MTRLTFFTFILCLLIAPAMANEQLTVNNVAVDVAGENAIDARESALTKARRDAFGVIAGRLMSETEKQSLPKASDQDIAAMVENFEINKEKLSKNRYLASVNITFNERAVYGYLGRYTAVAMPDMPYINNAGHSAMPQQASSSTRLVLPWYGTESDVTLWRDPNPWRDAWAAWARTEQAQGLKILVPMGDINDMQAFNPEKPLSFDHNALQRLLDRYGASQAIIAMADPLPNGMIRVSLYQSTNMTPRFIERVVAAGGTMSGHNRFLPAIYQSAEHIKNTENKAFSIAEQNQAIDETPSFAVDNTVSQAFEAEIKLANIQQWIGIKQSLSIVSGISGIQVKSLSPGRAVIAFRYAGDAESLRRDLQTRGLALYANPTQMSGASPYVIVRRNG